MTERASAFTSLVIFCILLSGAAGCSPPSTQPAVPPTPTIAPGWERFVHEGPCGYVMDFPADMDIASHYSPRSEAEREGTYSWIWTRTSAEPGVPAPNFIYISVIPDDFQNDGSEIIYNYNPVETRTLLSLQVGESQSLRDDPNLESWFTYSRLPDTTLGEQAAQTYENDLPWEFPPGTREIRYYLQANGCTYLVGGYMATVGSGQPGAMNEEQFDQVLASFRLAP